MPAKKKVLFICTHNSARSQMAEGLLNHLYGDRFEAYSAGVLPLRVHQFAIDAMNDIGIDISGHRAKGIGEFKDVEFEIVITVCDNAKETCPFFPAAKKLIHAGFENPVDYIGFEDVRNKINEWIVQTFKQ